MSKQKKTQKHKKQIKILGKNKTLNSSQNSKQAGLPNSRENLEKQNDKQNLENTKNLEKTKQSEQIQQVKTSSELPKIFVNIAAYRDTECQYTVSDLFAKAKFPDRIFVGICWQFDLVLDKDCFVLPYPRPDQVKVVNYHYKDSKGMLWARNEAYKLWNNQEYILQVDSHMRFEPNWDQEMIEMLENCDSEKPVLSSYPPNYTKPDIVERDNMIYMAYKEFEKTNDGFWLLLCNSVKLPLDKAFDKPLPTTTVCGNFLFARSGTFIDVPINPYIYFFGDELEYSIRLWTSGYDIFMPNKNLIYHLWDRESRPHNWKDFDRKKQINLTYLRISRLVDLEIPKNMDDPQAYIDFEKYPLGTVRSLYEFQSYSGVNFRTRTVSDLAKSGVSYPKWKKQTKVFTDAWREWIAENLLIDVPLESILTILLENLFDKQQAEKEIQAVRDNIYVKKLIQAKSKYFSPKAAQNPETITEKTSIELDSSHLLAHQKLVYASSDIIVIDNFLQKQDFLALYQKSLILDFERINTTGKMSNAWGPGDGFPIRSQKNYFYNHPKSNIPNPVFPDEIDLFLKKVGSFDNILQQTVQKNPWQKVSATVWIYPVGTSLGMHADGSGVYKGAYVYFLNPVWRHTWGGFLLAFEGQINDIAYSQSIADKGLVKKMFAYQPHYETLDSFGFSRAIWPKGNRMVFISNTAMHYVTPVTHLAGENNRISIAGFFT